jgi:colanic acid biosynthesis glycosyl transferase WcaI
MLSRGILARALLALEKLTYRAVHCVSAISDGMRERIVAKGVRADRVAVFRNGADDERVRPRPGATALRAEWGLEGRIVALYAGNLGVKQGLHTLLEAAQLLRDRADIAFVVVGDGGEKARLVEQARRRALCNVSFRPLQPGARLEELLATADLAVITQRKAVRDIVFPTKVAYIMCSGRPIVAAAAGDSELARAIDASGGGVVVEPEAPQALAAAIAALAAAPDLRDRLGASGRRYAERHFSHRVVFGEFADHITALAASRPASFP